MGPFKSKDTELYNRWKETGDKKALSELIHQLSPLIYSEVGRASGTLPSQALSAEAKKWTIKAIQTYDPSKGTQLSTHVVGYLPKIRRLNYKFQNAVRLPENLHLKFSQFDEAIKALSDRLNRDPSDEEIAEELGWKKTHVVKYRNSLYADLIESASPRPAQIVESTNESIILDHIKSKLTPEEKIIFENSKSLSSQELATRLGVTITRLNYLKSKLVAKIRDIQQETGFMR